MSVTNSDPTRTRMDAITKLANRRQVVAAAAESRAADKLSSAPRAPDPFSSEAFVPLSADQEPFYKILNSVLLQQASRSQIVKTLSTIRELFGNIVDCPEDKVAASMKFRSIRLRNDKVKKEILEVKGAEEILSAASFRRRAEDLEEHFIFPSSPTESQLYALKTGHYVISKALTKAKEDEALEKIRKEAAKAEKDLSWSLAMLAIKDDRDTMKQKEIRMKQAKRERAQMVLERKRKLDHAASGSSGSQVEDRGDEEEEKESTV